MLLSLEQERQAAMSNEASLRAQLEGPGAVEVNRSRNKVSRAADVWTEYPGYVNFNFYMRCVTNQINVAD